jgi:hypothetical protein
MKYMYTWSESFEAVHIFFWANFFTQILSYVRDDVYNSCRVSYDERGEQNFCIKTSQYIISQHV